MIEKEEIKNLLVTSKMPTITMFRLNVFGKRVYCSTNPFKVYSGLTGALSAVTFKGNQEAKRLSKWRDKMIDHLGGEGQQAYLNTMADFGTLTHACIVRAWDNGKLNWEQEQYAATEFFHQSAIENKIEPNPIIIKQQVFEYCKAAASLLAFLHAEVSELYAVEAMAKSDTLEIATPIDIFCKLKDGRNATLNIKTSSQFTDSHREQVAVERFLWNTTYNNADVTGLIRPKDWNMKKGVPTYELEILDAQVQKKLLDSAIARLLLAKDDESCTYLNYPKESKVFTGETKLGENPTFETKTLEQLFNQ